MLGTPCRRKRFLIRSSGSRFELAFSVTSVTERAREACAIGEPHRRLCLPCPSAIFSPDLILLFHSDLDLLFRVFRAGSVDAVPARFFSWDSASTASTQFSNRKVVSDEAFFPRVIHSDTACRVTFISLARRAFPDATAEIQRFVRSP